MEKKTTKFLFISIAGDSMPLCQRFEQIGYTCFFYVHKGKAKSVGDGIFKNKVEDYHEVLQNNKQNELIIIFDQNGLGYTADYLRRLGYKCVDVMGSHSSSLGLCLGEIVLQKLFKWNLGFLLNFLLFGNGFTRHLGKFLVYSAV